MKEKYKTSGSFDKSFVQNLWFKFFPFWPLFILLSVVFLIPACIYAILEKPTYVVTASLVINEEENRVNHNQPFGTLNAYATRQIVDNEVLVLHSRALMKNVVKELNLYAPLFEKESFSIVSAYLSSPIIIEAKEPDRLQATKGMIRFEFDNKSETVIIDEKIYPLNKWINFPFGTVRFIRNLRGYAPTDEPLSFAIVNPTIVADGLLKSLTVSPVSKLSTAISVAFRTDIPVKGEDIVNQLLREYLASSVESENQLAANTLDFVDDRLKGVEEELDSIERRIQRFRSAEGAINLTEQGRLYLQDVAENDRKISEINSQLAVLDQVERYLNSQGQQAGVIPTTLGIEDPVLAQLLQTLNQLELQLASLKTTTGENNPLVEAVKSEIQKIRPNIRSIVNNQQARLTASRNNLASTSGRSNNQLRAIPEQERELVEISRQQAVKRELYSFLLQRREEAALSNSSTIADHRIVDWAEASIAAVSSRRLIILIGSIFASFALGLAFIFFKEGLSSNILFRSQVESITSIPVVAEIAYKKHRSPLIFQNDTNLAVKGQFRQLQAGLGLLDSNRTGSQNILVTSGISNEGKSFISSNLATSLALSGKKVILVDCNLHSPEVATVFGIPEEIGLKNYLHGQTDLQGIIRATQFKNLDLIPAGERMDNPIELLLQDRLHELFSMLGQRYDYVIMDTPPVELATDAYVLSRYSTISLLVVRYGVTPANLLKGLDEDFKLQQLPNLGIVVNSIKGRGFVFKHYGYGYGYGKEYVFPDKAYRNAE